MNPAKAIFYLLSSVILTVTACEYRDEPEPVAQPTPITQPEPEPQNPEECLTKAAAENGSIIEGQYIVKYKPAEDFEINSGKRASAVLSRNNIDINTINQNFIGALQGFAAKLNSEQIQKLKQDPSIESIEPDRIVSIVSCHTEVSSQSIPWGIQRVGYGDGIGKTAWIIDTGVDLDHPDLNIDASRCKSFISGFGPEDDHGHGTHVAGIIGAKNNNLGVLGVAANATIIALKVMDSTGRGSMSAVVAAVNYVSNHAKYGDVVNMSIGGYSSDILDSAMIKAANKGILFAVAAGNNSTNASEASPARVNHANIFTVSAMNSEDSFASFSNYGTCVDLCAPGVNVASTFKNGGYASMSGTSMATPHVAGLLLLKGKNILTDGFVKNDPDENPDPIAHK